MSFGDDLAFFRDKVVRRSRLVFLGSVDGIHDSVVEGSTVTGAPGQPVDVGNLLGSWQQTYPEEWVGQTATNVEYARAIEEGQQGEYTTTPHTRVIRETGQVIDVAGGTRVTPRKMTLRSAVGGFHSVKLTRAGWKKVVAAAVADEAQ